MSSEPRPFVAGLLPVRNGVGHLDDWMTSALRIADVVVALDDGSTDDTLERLRSYPSVSTVLTNPARPTYAGWDDAANRQRLLDACEPLHPKWILQLDADERIDESDATALRSFLSEGADPTRAYLLRVYRMIDGSTSWDRRENWAGRIFAYERGLRLPDATLHFVPIPESIPRARWDRTTFRIQHLASVDERARRDRLAKYDQADPDRRFQANYDHLVDPPIARYPWMPRPTDLPPLLHGASRELDHDPLVVPAVAGVTPAPSWVVDAASTVPGAAIYVTSQPDTDRLSPTDWLVDPARNGDAAGSLASTLPPRASAIRASLHERFASSSSEPLWDEIVAAVWNAGYGAGIVTGPRRDPKPTRHERSTLGAVWALGERRAQRAIAEIDDRGATAALLRRRIGLRAFAGDLRRYARRRWATGSSTGSRVRAIGDASLGVVVIGVDHLAARHALRTKRARQTRPGDAT